MQAPKDNANPIIHHVDNSSRSRFASQRISPLSRWSLITTDVQTEDSYNGFNNNDDNDMNNNNNNMDYERQLSINLFRTPEDRTALLALQSVAEMTNGKNVSLLQRLGLQLPKSTDDLINNLSPPSFIPSAKRATDKLNASKSNAQSDNANATETTHIRDAWTVDEIYDIVRNIQDPEHPLTLEQLGVVSKSQIELKLPSSIDNDGDNLIHCHLRFTPTIPHCSMATQIGLCLMVKLQRSLPSHNTRIRVSIEPGTHASENAINKQLADKERVCAALENKHLLTVVNRCIENGMIGAM